LPFLYLPLEKEKLSMSLLEFTSKGIYCKKKRTSFSTHGGELIKRLFHMGITVAPDFKEDTFYFSHFPTKKKENFVFCGHVNTRVKLKGAGLQQLKMPCFYQSRNQLILPSFGAFTGLHILTPKEGDCVYVTSGKEVMEIDKN